jgi:hypothetical protein
MATVFPNITEWYDVNGVELATHGYMLSSVERGLAAKKGENVGSAIIHGQQWREKRLDVRNETWTIWITDNDPVTGSVSTNEAGRRGQFNENYDTVFNLLNEMPELLTVTHVRVDSDDPSQYLSRVAYGEIISGITVSDHRDLNYTEFSVDVLFPDPRWFSLTSISPSLSASYSGSPAQVQCFAGDVGTAPVTYMTITFTSTSSLANPRLVNETYPNSLSAIGYNGTIPTGQSVVIDTDALTLERSGINDIAKLYRAGARQSWFELFPIDNELTFSASSGTGTVSISYRKAFY